MHKSRENVEYINMAERTNFLHSDYISRKFILLRFNGVRRKRFVNEFSMLIKESILINKLRHALSTMKAKDTISTDMKLPLIR